MATYSDYHILTKPYKVVKGHEILVDVLLHPSLGTGRHPIIVFWHGGALISGHRAFLPLIPAWLAGLAHAHSAIIVSADYRLLPEASGADIVSDIASLWLWLHDSLPAVLAAHYASTSSSGGRSPPEADLSRILVTGGSAGGFCAVHMALLASDGVRAMFLQYPAVDVGDELHTRGNAGQPVMGRAPPSRATTEAYLAQCDRSAVVTGGEAERLHWANGIWGWGFAAAYLGEGGGDGMLYPFEQIERAGRLPRRIYLIHGTADTAVPVSGSENFIELVRRKCPDTELRAEIFDGKEHCFDLTTSTSEEWLARGLAWLAEAWLG